MKNLRLLIAVLFCTLISFGNAFSQQDEKSLAEKLQLVEEQNKAFNFYLNMQNRGNLELQDGKFRKAYFKNEQLRLEIRGSISDKVSYRLRHRLNKDNTGKNLDGISKATDFASISVAAMDNFTITMGKQCTAYGGYEFDLNPIDIYQYSDMIDYMDNFLTGIDFAYLVASQEFRLQILDVRSEKFTSYYAGYANLNEFEASKFPLMYTLNWNGNLLDGIIQTRWSYTLGEDAKDQYMNYIALGTQVKINDMFQVQLDWMNSKEDIDRKGIISELSNSYFASNNLATGAEYDSYVAKLDFRASNDWNFMFKGMYETATADGLDTEARVAISYVAGVEYAPFDDNIKFFANYTRRDISFKSNYGTDYNTERFSLGMVYRLKMF
jgi:hypothetical protein